MGLIRKAIKYGIAFGIGFYIGSGCTASKALEEVISNDKYAPSYQAADQPGTCYYIKEQPGLYRAERAC